MRKWLVLAFSAVVSMAFVGCEKKARFEHRAPNYSITDANVALAMLKEGNRRFVENELMPRTTNLADREIIAEGQWPFAVVITCADSRVSPEIYFDQKQGDIFVLRNAGNIADQTALGSLEFAVEHLGAVLVVVVGHSGCGAVITAHAGQEVIQTLTPNLQAVLNKVAANIPNSTNATDAIVENVNTNVAKVAANEVVQRMGAKVVGANFDIGTGVVTFFE